MNRKPVKDFILGAGLTALRQAASWLLIARLFRRIRALKKDRQKQRQEIIGLRTVVVCLVLLLLWAALALWMFRPDLF